MLALSPPLEIAGRLEESLRSFAGVAGLDPKSRLCTTGAGGMILGAAVNTTAAGDLEVALDLVARDGVRLPDAGSAARDAAQRVCTECGYPAATVEVRFTDIATEVGPQHVGGPPTPPHAPPTPPLRETVPIRDRNRQTVDVPVSGNQTVLRITVETIDNAA
jgi:hypothetical protein